MSFQIIQRSTFYSYYRCRRMLEMSHLRVTINQQRINVLAKQFNENPQQVTVFTASQRESTVKTGINRVHCDIHQHVPVSCRISVFYIKK